MPDFSMCSSTVCTQRETCLRNEASGTKPGKQQAWLDGSPHLTEDDKCIFYSEVKPPQESFDLGEK